MSGKMTCECLATPGFIYVKGGRGGQDNKAVEEIYGKEGLGEVALR